MTILIRLDVKGMILLPKLPMPNMIDMKTRKVDVLIADKILHPKLGLNEDQKMNPLKGIAIKRTMKDQMIGEDLGSLQLQTKVVPRVTIQEKKVETTEGMIHLNKKKGDILEKDKIHPMKRIIADLNDLQIKILTEKVIVQDHPNMTLTETEIIEVEDKIPQTEMTTKGVLENVMTALKTAIVPKGIDILTMIPRDHPQEELNILLQFPMKKNAELKQKIPLTKIPSNQRLNKKNTRLLRTLKQC